jgi:RNA ligase (TIGR02306 family)
MASECPRALASIVRIDDIAPIAGSDNVVAARVKGWTCVVNKSEGFSRGDLAVYFEIDSLLPTGTECPGDCSNDSCIDGKSACGGGPFDFLNAMGCFARVEGVGQGYRIKTRKLRGVVSQGLLMPLRAFGWRPDDTLSLSATRRAAASTSAPAADIGSTLSSDTVGGSASSEARVASERSSEEAVIDEDTVRVHEGADVTHVLQVKKWERIDAHPPSCPAGAWPPFLRKTDQPRIQNVWNRVVQRREERLASGLGFEVFEVTLKCDGTSLTAFHKDGVFGVCSRNLQVKSGVDGGVYALLGDPIAAALKERKLNVAIQAEIMGPRICGNREKFMVPKAFVFDVWDIDTQSYWPADRRRALCEELGLTHVPRIAETTLEEFRSVDDILRHAERRSLHHIIAEGCVWKSLSDPAFSFKAVATSYLLLKGAA